MKAATAGERDYTLLAIGGLLVVVVLLVDEGLGWWALVPLSGGALGVLVPGAVAVPFVLFSILVLVTLRSSLQGFFFTPMEDASPLVVAIFAAAVMAYVVGHTRVLAIKRHAVPPDARRERKSRGTRLAGRWLLPSEPSRRTALPSGEFAALAAGVPVFVIVAYLLWLRVLLEPPMVDVPVPLWRIMVVAWAFVIGLVVVHTLISYLRRALASREESLLYLQDQLWAATRGEQRRINSWRASARLRREREEGG